MKVSEKRFCDTHCRHLRLLFLVDHRVSNRFLIDLLTDNYKIWGGRYNPVIPVYDKKISPYYQNLIDHFDPDIIYYSEQVGLDAAQSICKRLNANELKQLDPNGYDNFPGVYAHNLLAEAHSQATYYLRNFSLVYFNRHEEDLQTSFYNLSFGIGNEYADDLVFNNGYHKTILDVTNISETNRHIGEKRPFFNSILAQQQPEFTLLQPENDWEFNCFEFIVYDENQAFDDLIYFWNRALSQRPKGEQLQMIASNAQLDLMMADLNFGALLRSVARDNTIYLHSLSISAADLEIYRGSLQTTFPGPAYRIADSRHFPRIRQAESFPYRREIRITKNLLLGSKDHLRVPAPNWYQERALTRGNYVYDAEFYEEGDYTSNYIKFPYGTVTQYVLGTHESRVNKAHHISFFLNPEKQGLDIRIPTAIDIFRTRIQSKSTLGTTVNLHVRNLKISDAGLKLSSFVNLFDGKLSACSEILSERFWVDLILGKSTGSQKKKFAFKRLKQTDKGEVDEPFEVETGESNIHNNDGTFNHLDIEAERKLIYLEHLPGIKEWHAEEGQNYDDDQLLDFIARSGKEDFERHIDPDLQYMVDRDALFIGMKVKCPHCGSNTWYPLMDLKNKMNCKGCLETIIPIIESRLYYRFNDVVYNNLSSDPVKREKTYHGNYIVLRTLANFERHHSGHESFYWLPSSDIGVKSGNGFIGTDIDVAIIRQGKLIIGEAKATASDFNAKQFKQLLLMAEAIQPDQLILAWMNGNINEERLNQLKENVAHIGCEVITHHVEEPIYLMGRIR